MSLVVLCLHDTVGFPAQSCDWMQLIQPTRFKFVKINRSALKSIEFRRKLRCLLLNLLAYYYYYYLLTYLLAYLFIYLFTYLFVYLLTSLFTYSFIYLLTFLFTYLFTYYLLTYLLIYLLTYPLTPCSTVLLGKLTDSQLVKKFLLLYGTRRFITAFTSARKLSLSSASSIQSLPPHPTS